MAALPSLPVHEVVAGEWVLRLDGTVLELFHDRVRDTTRLHVRHLAVEAVPRGDDLRLTVGFDVGGRVTGDRVDVPGAHRDDVLALFAEARRRREAFGG